jgi:MtrB/PioB family decaheme-associated outer membrane protein
MKRTATQCRHAWLAAAAAALFAVPTLQAQTATDEAWACRFCTYASGWYGTLDLGLGHLGDENLRYTGYRGLDKDGAFLALDGQAHYRGEGDSWFDLVARDLGSERRQLELRGGRRGAYTLELNYAEVSRHRGFGANTPFLGVGSNRLALPADWTAAATTDGMTHLAAALRAVDLSTKRRTLRGGLDLRLSGSWRYEAKVRHVNKQGLRPYGAGVFTIQSSHIPAPVDFSENAVGMALNYAGERSALRISLDRSWFNNTQAFVTWQNPFEPVGNTQYLRSALEPDSDAWRLGLAGTYSSASGVRMSAQASLGRHQQDDPFLPYSINPDFDHLELPRASLGGKVDLQSINLATRLSARLSRSLNLRLSARVDERDNRTPVTAFTPVITDLVERPETLNRPYSFKRRQLSAALDHRLGRSARLHAGVRRLERERSLQAVRETRQTTWWGEISLHHWSAAQLRLRAESSDRNSEPYLTVNDPGLQENPLTRKFNLAGRERRRLALELELAPTDRLSTSVGLYRSRDDYEASGLGLLDSVEDSINLDITYQFGPEISVFAFANLDHYDSQLAGAVFDGAPPWFATTKDRFLTFGAGLTHRINPRFELGLQFHASHARGRIATDSGAGEAPFPELRHRLHYTRLSLAYRADGPWGWTLLAERERQRSTDWQTDPVAPDTLPAILAFGSQSPDARAVLLRLQAHYRF